MTAERGLLLHLAGPLQSWGERSHFTQRDSAAYPTVSGIVGLLACALGRPRHADITDLAALDLTVRVDRPGSRLTDLHTVGGGLPAKATVITAEGKRRSEATSTVLTRRTYLMDAAFTCAVTGLSADLVDACTQALTAPRWPLFLGRRSCPPEGPVLLATADSVNEHLFTMPLAARPLKERTVAFVSTAPLSRLDGIAATGAEDPTSKINDVPLTFDPRNRSYQTRPLFKRRVIFPDHVYAGYGISYLNALAAYLGEHFPARERSPR